MTRDTAENASDPAPGVGAPPASFGRRLAAFAVDALASVLVAAVFTYPQAPKMWSSAVLFLSYTFFTGFFAQTPGMWQLGIACVGVSDGRPLGVPRAALRAALLQLVLPALVMDKDGRGWHDRAGGAVVVRVKGLSGGEAQPPRA